jgi:hypothetical protein
MKKPLLIFFSILQPISSEPRFIMLKRAKKLKMDFSSKVIITVPMSTCAAQWCSTIDSTKFTTGQV